MIFPILMCKHGLDSAFKAEDGLQPLDFHFCTGVPNTKILVALAIWHPHVMLVVLCSWAPDYQSNAIDFFPP